MSEMHVTQVAPHEKWPSGDSHPIAHLALEPEDLAARGDLAFQAGADDLGDYVLAAIEPFPGKQVWLIRHADSPVPGVEVYADSAEPDGPLLARILELFGLAPAAVVWSPSPIRELPVELEEFARHLAGRGWTVAAIGNRAALATVDGSIVLWLPIEMAGSATLVGGEVAHALDVLQRRAS